MRILLIEDETHKRDDLVNSVREVFGLLPDVVDSVRGGVLKVTHEEFDLVILDMALPTFGEGAGDKIKGHDQAQGGIEVLRALNLKKQIAKVIIVTQYPDFYIGAEKVKLKDAGRIIGEKYNQEVLAAVLYKYKSAATMQKITSILRTQL